MAYEYGSGGGSLGGLMGQIMRDVDGGLRGNAIEYNPQTVHDKRVSIDRARWLKEFLPYVAQASAAEEADRRRYRYQYGI